MDLLTSKFKQSLTSPTVSTHFSAEVKQYQRNLKQFIQKVQTEVSLLIEKYQKTIKQLKQQNYSLRQQLNKTSKYHNPEESTFQKQTPFHSISPIKNGKYSYQQQPRLFNSGPLKNSPFHQTDLLIKSYSQYEGQDLSSSRFQANKSRMKMKQQNLLTSLEAGQNHLNNNTSKLLELLGKNKNSQINDNQGEDQEQQEVKSTQSKNQIMNTSLSSVCESLDNSFHGKKSKKKHQAKRKQKERLKQLRVQQAKKNYKQRKQQGLKNLLKCLRMNVSSNEEKPLQTLKSLKLLQNDSQVNQNGKKENQGKSSTKSKVLINPYPIDISDRKQKSNLNQSLQKKPHSILKKTQTILSKSVLSNLSFYNQDR